MRGFGYDLGEINRQSGGAVVVFGGQVGSEGKGAICGYLARRGEYGASVCNFMTNAGHSWVDDDGEKVVVQQIPIALVSSSVRQLLIGPGAAITVPVLLAEIERHDLAFNVAARLMIDPRAMIIEEHHMEEGREHARQRAGVGKGCGRAQAAKAMRLPGVKLARDVPALREFLGDTVAKVNDTLNSGQRVLVEGSQGFDLDLNHGFSYPHCTSRGCTPAAILADCGIDGKMVVQSIAVVRTFPIRVGNIVEKGETVGYSGDYGQEIGWPAVAAQAGVPVDDLTTSELTTVSRRLRRVFKMNYERLARMSLICRPTEVALTFADYLDGRIRGKTTADVTRGWLSPYPEVSEMVFRVTAAAKRSTWAPPVRMIKTGARDSMMIDFQNNAEPGVQRGFFDESPAYREEAFPDSV